MKRFLFILSIFAICILLPVSADEWSDISASGNLWGEQKSITNAEFEKAIDVLEGKKKQKEAKKRKKRVKKLSGGGTSLHSGLDPMSEIKAQDPLKKHDNEGQLLNVPVHLYIDGKSLETGFYNVIGEKDKKGDIYLSFYQSQYLKGKIKASETNDDFDSDSINFVKLVFYNSDYIKVVYGSLDFNAYAYIRYTE